MKHYVSDHIFSGQAVEGGHKFTRTESQLVLQGCRGDVDMQRGALDITTLRVAVGHRPNYLLPLEAYLLPKIFIAVASAGYGPFDDLSHRHCVMFLHNSLIKIPSG